MKLIRLVPLVFLFLLGSTTHAAEKRLADRIVDDVENLLRGKGSVLVFEMRVRHPNWQRKMRMKLWEVVPDKALVRILAPPTDAGMATLKLGRDLWSYNPHIDQIQKIPPSLMLDSWMGSDFTNDDIARESSIRSDYTTGEVTEGHRDGVKTWRLELLPKPESPVVWEKIVLEVDQRNHRPLRQEYYDETGKVARVMTFSDYRKVGGGKVYPFHWRMENLQEPGRYTEVTVLSLEFTETLPDRLFTIRSLKRRG